MHDPHSSSADSRRMETLLKKKTMTIHGRNAFRDELFGKLVREMYVEGSDHPSIWHAFDWLLVRRTLITTVAIGVIGGMSAVTGYAYVSPEVTRQDSLYVLKQAVESLQLALKTDPEAKAETLLNFADRRSQEAQYLSNHGIIDPETIERLTQTIERANALSETVDDGDAKTVLKSHINETSRRQKEQLLTMIASLRIESGSDAPTEPIPPVHPEDPTETETQPPPPQPVIRNATPQAATLPPAFSALQKHADQLEQIETNTRPKNDDSKQADDRASERKPEKEDPPKPPRPGRTPMPDLQVKVLTDGSWPAAQERVFTVGIDNTGDADAGTFLIRFDWGDGTSGQETVDGVGISGSKDIQLSHTYRQPGQYFFSVSVNGTRAFAEQSESNNTTRAFIQVTDSAEPSVCLHACDAQGTVCKDNDVYQCTIQSNGCRGWTLLETCSSKSCSDGICLPPVPAPLPIPPHSICGNGIEERSEQCDDGNVISGDGCSAVCKDESHGKAR